MRMKNIFLCISLLQISLQACGENNAVKPSELHNSDSIIVDPEPGTIAIPKLVTSVQIDEVEKIQLPPTKNPEVKRTVSASRDNVVATLEDGYLVIKGQSLGIANVSLTDSDGSKASMKVRVYDPRYLDIGDLLIGYTDQFDWTWNNDDSSDYAGGSFSFWTPRIPAGFYYLGTLANPGYGDPTHSRMAIIVKDINESKMLAKPIKFEWVWDSWTIDSYHEASIWRPVPPPDYVCLGFLGKYGKQAPSIDNTMIRCVHKSLVGRGSAGDIKWNTQGKKYDQWHYTIQEIAEPNFTVDKNFIYLPTGTFVGAPGDSTPSDLSLYNVLKFEAPIFLEFADRTVRPNLTSTEPPAESTPNILSRVIAVPFTFIKDDAYDLNWKVNNSPFYQLRNESFYRLVDSHYNGSSTTHETKSIAIESGISNEVATTHSHEVGVLIGVEGEVGFLGTGTKMKLELSYKYGYSMTTGSTDYTSKTETITLDVPPESIGAIYQLVNSYQLERNSDDDKLVGNPWTVDSDHTMVDFYPN